MKVTTATAKNTRDIAKKAIREVTAEPFEILKKAKEQVLDSGWENQYANEEKPYENDSSPGPSYAEKEKEEKIKTKDTRMLSALNREIEDIRRDKLFKELQARISAGEETSLESYGELTLEQKQVLKAQMEAYKLRVQKEESKGSLSQPTTKRSRRLFGFGKQQAEKLQTKVERPMPPSG